MFPGGPAIPTFDPVDHAERLRRALTSLDGLSVGDAFGQRFFRDDAEAAVESRALPPPPWNYTDDTEQAMAVVEALDAAGRVEQDDLAARLARRYRARPWRGYGGTSHRILQDIGSGMHWAEAASRAFSGMGSMGNGGAMRVAPLGAWFADDYEAAAEQARLSAQVTHFHPDAQAGAVAVAVAAAWAWRVSVGLEPADGLRLIQTAWDHTPDGPTREGLARAMTIPTDLSVWSAVGWLGNGLKLLSEDTVPFALWCAARHPDDFAEAMWATVTGLGDRDTTCAIVGGIVSLSVGSRGLPADWLASRELLDLEV